ncbi:hypothetical protein [Yoonia sp. TsM2_T14_4]|uniref:hypothetical protein n=1 Tax=Yoonia sp. TsM2_T14_4 TaxID=3415141 RepID=UPI003C786399
MSNDTIMAFFKPQPLVAVEDTYWGYLIRSERGESFGFVLLQSACLVLGMACLVMAAGVATLTPLMFGVALTPFRMAVVALLGAVAAYLLWFASRGTRTEIHIDTSIREIHQVIRNRAGRPTILRTHDFAQITDILTQRDDASGTALLVLQGNDTVLSICIAMASAPRLDALHDRLARDVTGDPRVT